jgi:hypothetical protein
MIYLKQTEDVQRVFIPKHNDSAAPMSAISLRFHGSLSEGECEIVEIKQSSLYYELLIKLPEDMLPGEYSYSLRDSDIELSSGVFAVDGQIQKIEYLLGDFVQVAYEDRVEFFQYNSQKKQFENIITIDGKVLFVRGKELFVKK